MPQTPLAGVLCLLAYFALTTGKIENCFLWACYVRVVLIFLLTSLLATPLDLFKFHAATYNEVFWSRFIADLKCSN